MEFLPHRECLYSTSVVIDKQLSKMFDSIYSPRHQQCMRVLFALHPCWRLVLSAFFILALLTKYSNIGIEVLIFISLMTKWGSFPYIYTHLDIVFCQVSDSFAYFYIKLSTSFSRLFSVCIVTFSYERCYIYWYNQI